MSEGTKPKPAAPRSIIPLFTAVAVLRNNQHDVEQIIGPFLQPEISGGELIIINDGSADGTHDAVTSLLDYFSRDDVYYFENEIPRGTSLCLNMALGEARSSAFIFIDEPLELSFFDLTNALESLKNSTSAFLLPEDQSFSDVKTIRKMIGVKKLPSSLNFILRTDRIPSHQLFFNPFIDRGQSAELFLRSGLAQAHTLAPPCFFSTEKPELVISISEKDAAAVAFSLNTAKHSADIPDSSDSMYEDAVALKLDGRIADALHKCDELLTKFPEHDDALNLKIELLHRLKHFVEASEIIHQRNLQKHRKTSVSQTPAASSAILNRTSEEDSGNSSSEYDENKKPKTVALDEKSVGSKPQSDLFGSADKPANTEETTDAPSGTGSSRFKIQTESSSPDSDTDKDTGSVGKYNYADSQDESVLTKETSTVDDEAEEEERKSYEAVNRDISYTNDDSVEAEDEYSSEDESESEPEASAEPYVRPDSFRHSVIVPVTALGLDFIENFVVSLNAYGSEADTELIVIDNVCLDDTYAYLKQLEESHFFHIHVIRNKENKGFAAAVNQGIKQALGTYILVCHNDIALVSNLPKQLAAILEKNPDVGMVGPTTDNSWNEHQTVEKHADPLSCTEVPVLDSFCFCIRAEDALKMEERYGLAWYDDVHLCLEVQQRARKTVLASGVFVPHFGGGTTSQLGIEADSPLFYANQQLLNESWRFPAASPQQDEDEELHPVEELYRLGQMVNVYYPHPDHVKRIKKLFTGETEVDLRNLGKLSDIDLISFIRAMMVIDNRSFMRQFEEQLENMLDEESGLELVYFYYERHIYSRCKKHLNRIEGEPGLLRKLYNLKIAWGEREVETAVKYLADLLEQYPACPEVNAIAAQVHDFAGNKEESESFATLAKQLYPEKYREVLA
ncbi:MAG: glycosyltransferase [Balneolales bacterium]|nr:glycosyltransferase [Balneolales bacterium]